MPSIIRAGLVHRLEQLSGLLSHVACIPWALVAEQFPGDPDLPRFVHALKHPSSSRRPFPSHNVPWPLIPTFGHPFRPVHPVLEPHPTFSLQPVPLPDVGLALRLPDLVTSSHHILDDVEPVLGQQGVPEVVAHSLGVGRTDVDRHTLDGLGTAVLPEQFRSDFLRNRRIVYGRDKGDPLGHQIGEHCQVFVPLTPVYIFGCHPHHVCEAQLRMGSLHSGKEHPPHLRVVLDKDIAGKRHRYLMH